MDIKNSKGEREAKLLLFLKYVEKKELPPRHLLEYVAEGVNDFLKDGKPWKIKTGRKGQINDKDKNQLIQQCGLLHESGITKLRIADALQMTDLDGTNKTKTLNRYIEMGSVLFESDNGSFYIRQAYEYLLENPRLVPKERELLADYLVNYEKDQYFRRRIEHIRQPIQKAE